MCGIAGFIQPSGFSSKTEAVCRVQRMAETLRERGPNNQGIWVDQGGEIALAHRRLSILDLSPLGHQPMVSASGCTVMIYNGEVFNFQELRAELEGLGHSFRGHSDTEVILEGCERWGVVETAKKLIGMFAFAVWNRETRVLSLARDRLGIKPLYWARFGSTLMFGSQVKALKQHPAFKAEIDRGSLTLLMRHNYIPCPYSIYRGVHKMRPGSVLEFRSDGIERETIFWSLEQVASQGIRNRKDISDKEAVDQLDSLLRDAVRRQMVADVPLGAFLSGGIDSSTVVALMQAQSSKPVHTFSIGFTESDYNEAPHAEAVARHLGTEHTTMMVTPREAQSVIPRLPDIYDEPFADSSQIPTFLVSALARRYVTVSLSGDGGDELFAGYNRYEYAKAISQASAPWPKHIREPVARILQGLSPKTWDRLFSLVPPSFRPPQAGNKVHKLANLIDGNPDKIYLGLISHWQKPESVVIGGIEPDTCLRDKNVANIVPDSGERMQYLDTLTYLPDDILVKLDRASMAVSLEARVPLLDHRVVAWAWSLPQRFRRRHAENKWILRQVLYRYAPRNLFDRPKMGFGVPIDSWLRGPLRNWAEDLLDSSRLRQDGYLRPEPILEKWREHLSSKTNWAYLIWDVLMFQAWLAKNR
jgi:asparagine synthase (glutamine-hydrolysing)